MKLKIAILPGDGIGPEVTNDSIKVLNCIAKEFNHDVEMSTGLVGAIAIDQYNDPYPDETHKLCSESEAILFGAIGDPKYDNDPKAKIRPEQGLLKLRKKLGLYANLRPTKVFDSLLEMKLLELLKWDLNMQKKDLRNSVVLIKPIFLRPLDFGEKQFKAWKKITLM